MQIVATPIQDLYIIQPTVFEDPRGYFFESYNKAVLSRHGIHAEFVQDNQSLSQKGVLRGLHFQHPPFAQGKLVRVIKGAVLDVAVDLRRSSATYGHHFDMELNERNKTMLWIPEGFAHGFLTLENDTIFSYKCTNVYDKASEGCICWNDPDLGIQWNIQDPVLSAKDKECTPFRNFESRF